MKRRQNLYSNITDIKQIMHIYSDEIKKNTKNKKKLEKFEEYLLLQFTDIHINLLNEKLNFKGYYIFLIREPKYRIIMSQSISDKIVNHLVARKIVLEAFDKSLIDANVATRDGKGTSYGIKLLRKYITELKKEKKEIYYLKCDISKYFYNIDHAVLKEIIRSKIKDKKACKMVDEIIDTTTDIKVSKNIRKLIEKEIMKMETLSISNMEKQKKIKELQSIPTFEDKGKGIPIGNMTSQVFAIIYLNGLDHFIKEKLHAKYYLRYMDDFVMLDTDKNKLKEMKQQIEKELKEKYKLELNPKTQIGMLKNGLDILGYRFLLDHNKLYLKLRNSTKKKFKKKIKYMYKQYHQEKISYEKVVNVEGSYYGHLLTGNTYYLYHKVIDPYKQKEIELGNKIKV